MIVKRDAWFKLTQNGHLKSRFIVLGSCVAVIDAVVALSVGDVGLFVFSRDGVVV